MIREKSVNWTLGMFLLGLGVIILTYSCGEANRDLDKDNVPDNVSIQIIEGCEYVVFHNGNATWGAHKGNCKNKFHEKSNSDQ